MTRQTLARLALVVLVVGGLGPRVPSPAAAQGPDQGISVPTFQADPAWPKLPNNWVLGEVSSVAVDRRDHVWILHRPRTVPAELQSRAAPSVLEIDPAGNYVKTLGGPSDAYDWPDNEHGIYVDHKDNVWIGGNNPSVGATTQRSDDMMLKFTNTGKFIRQIGGAIRAAGNKDTTNLKGLPRCSCMQKRTKYSWPMDTGTVA